MMPSSTNSACYILDDFQDMEAFFDFQNADFSWMGAVTMIDDHELMFGGKPLCAWHEEGRQRISNPYDEEEEHRGRRRVRREYSHHSTTSNQCETTESPGSNTNGSNKQ